MYYIISKKMHDTVDDNLDLVIKGDAWFGSVKTAANLAQRGIEGICK